jgi:hypothetical protein
VRNVRGAGAAARLAHADRRSPDLAVRSKCFHDGIHFRDHLEISDEGTDRAMHVKVMSDSRRNAVAIVIRAFCVLVLLPLTAGKVSAQVGLSRRPTR